MKDGGGYEGVTSVREDNDLTLTKNSKLDEKPTMDHSGVSSDLNQMKVSGKN